MNVVNHVCGHWRTISVALLHRRRDGATELISSPISLTSFTEPVLMQSITGAPELNLQWQGVR